MLAEAVRTEKARRSLHEFVKAAWHVVEPATPLHDNWHVGAICEHLEAVTRGEITRLLINVPPGHAKSLLVAVFWPAWVWVRRPSWRALFASYSGELSLRDSVRCRHLVESDWYGERFSAPAGWRLAGDQNVKSNFSNSASGFRIALSVAGKATGLRGDAVVVDDPLNAKDAHSKLAREQAVFWWDQVMSSRLNDQRTGARVIIMQRLHEEDLSGHVLERGGYEHLCLPSEFDPTRRSSTCRTVVRVNGHRHVERIPFWTDPRNEPGELLFPTLFPRDVLDSARRDLGSDGYAGQHDQRPTSSVGGVFRRAWWRFWKPDGRAADGSTPRPRGCDTSPAVALPPLERVTISLDATFKGAAHNDWVVFQVWGTRGADRFLLGQERGHWSFSETLAVFRRLVVAYPMARRKLVEDKANGSAIIDTLRSEIPGIVAVNPEGGKEARASAVQPQVEAGNVYLPEGAAWLDEFVEEMAAFPRGKHDDQVDAMTQALIDATSSTAVSRARAMVTM